MGINLKLRKKSHGHKPSTTYCLQAKFEIQAICRSEKSFLRKIDFLVFFLNTQN